MREVKEHTRNFVEEAKAVILEGKSRSVTGPAYVLRYNFRARAWEVNSTIPMNTSRIVFEDEVALFVSDSWQASAIAFKLDVAPRAELLR